MAGLVLIEVFGLTGALFVGAGCSAIAGVVALAIARRSTETLETIPSAPVTAAPREPEPAAPGRRTLALTVAFISGLTSLGYQVLWTRLLASGTGNTTYVFTIILGVFLIGLAIGALLFNYLRPRITDPIRLLAMAQILVAALVMAGLVVVVVRPEALDARRLAGDTPGAYRIGRSWWCCR